MTIIMFESKIQKNLQPICVFNGVSWFRYPWFIYGHDYKI